MQDTDFDGAVAAALNLSSHTGDEDRSVADGSTGMVCDIEAQVEAPLVVNP
jgi:hypothetical protein